MGLLAWPPGVAGLATWGCRSGHLGLQAWPPGVAGLATWGYRPGHLGLRLQWDGRVPPL